MLKKVGGQLIKVASNDNLILCKMCGGIFGDPYNGIELKKNILKIKGRGQSGLRMENFKKCIAVLCESHEN